MKILLHACCGPCTIYPLARLREAGMTVMGFFYRRNIHPYQECLRREETLRQWAQTVDLKVIFQEGYDLAGFIQQVVHREAQRCPICYHDRLRTTALMAKRGKFDAFTSTLLYSRHQRHDLIREIGESVGRQVGLPFYYADFREGWQAGIEASKAVGMYRQSYCGCIYSEKERYYRPHVR
jgi:predicted adenine nucleotide alpha hydrolase (AANH) superfamily ATPase